MTKLICGLGNPGAEYIMNRHNIGFMAVDAFAQDLPEAVMFKKNKVTDYALVRGDSRCGNFILAKPLTFMNRSGQAVLPLMQFYKIPLKDVLVIHDDLDLVFGDIRKKTGGGHGGHNGLRDIDRAVGKDYARLRLGIGHPGHKDMVTGHVLGNFNKTESAQLPDILQRACDEIQAWLNIT